MKIDKKKLKSISGGSLPTGVSQILESNGIDTNYIDNLSSRDGPGIDIKGSTNFGNATINNNPSFVNNITDHQRITRKSNTEYKRRNILFL